MVDITNKPYFSYTSVIEKISLTLLNLANVKLLCFVRNFPNLERFLIGNKEWSLDFYTKHRLYQWGLHEKGYEKTLSEFQMWEHLPYAPPKIYDRLRTEYDLAHGLYITRQYGTHMDLFIFATNLGNSQVNNFYINQKKLFLKFIDDFYANLNDEFLFLQNCRFMVPQDTFYGQASLITLSPRQKECAHLLTEGMVTKEIAQKLLISPRTVEYHIDALREKFHAKNRAELVNSISKIL